jgi:Flp pilus assembly protein TadG
MLTWRRRRKGDRGAAAVEFALVVPVLVTLVFGMIDFGWAINRYSAVGNAAREGVRVASIGGTAAEITSTVNASVSDIGGGGTTTVAVTCTKPAGTTCTYASNAVPGDTAIVTVTYKVNWLTPVGSTFGSQMTVTKASRMRIE